MSEAKFVSVLADVTLVAVSSDDSEDRGEESDLDSVSIRGGAATKQGKYFAKAASSMDGALFVCGTVKSKQLKLSLR